MEEEEKKEARSPVNPSSGSDSDSVFNNCEDRIAEQEQSR